MLGVKEICLKSKSKNPIEILKELMALEGCRMHGPEHHVLVGSALLSAYKNAGGEVELDEALDELEKRATQVPGAACALWGSCGAGISAGMFISIVTGASPMSGQLWRLPGRATTNSLGKIYSYGGPRCCKRDSYLSIIACTEFTKSELGVQMELDEVACVHSQINKTCIKKACPFYKE
jgi:hypothetical protein